MATKLLSIEIDKNLKKGSIIIETEKGFNYFILFGISILLIRLNPIFDTVISTFVIPVLWLTMLKTKYFDMLLFMMAFFFNYLGMFANHISLVWIYILLYYLKRFINGNTNMQIKGFLFALIISIYQIIFPVSGSMTEGIKYISFVFMMILYMYEVNKGIKKYKDIFFSLGFFMTISALIPLLNPEGVRAIDVTNLYTRISSGGFQDPNYTSFGMLCGIIGYLNIRFPRRLEILRYLSIAIMTVTIIRSISISGTIGLLTVMMIYVIFQNRVSNMIKTIVGLLTLICLVILFTSSFQEYLNPLLERIYLVSGQMQRGDIVTATSDRQFIFNDYIKYFESLPVIYQLFGLHEMANIHLVQIIGNVTHNSFLDMLYMYGFIGSSIILIYMVRSVYFNLRYFKNGLDSNYLSVALMKISLLYFSFSLSILPTTMWIVIFFL